jgi:hypothetical protein
LSEPGLVKYLERFDKYKGGEEYLSFLFISELLFARGGKQWNVWNARVTRRLVRQQHANGSWSAEHCLCGGNFCTPAALLTLLADPANRRQPPAGAKKASSPAGTSSRSSKTPANGRRP